ncbi:Transcriptional regulatory protein [Lachnellula occidentalis]|uniref:Transcriptional regulatory protein n=1 Tax=Lachnellula occidentalis TaxID=215460 RepID=A0A8H8RTY7_9HELO|nr:Transcriptional regulatory protein [Lachnellula occidentalis]
MDKAEFSDLHDPSLSQEISTELYRWPSVENDVRASKKARASRPKVKSGCITCKVRRVKCDETKPHCVRCQKFGIGCDGYVTEPQQSQGLLQLRPRIPSVGPYTPSVSIHETEEESRYFHVFAECMAHELPGFFEGTISSNFWTQFILQESHNVTSIRHAVIALGALRKSLDNAPRSPLKVNIIQDIDKKHHEAAVLQQLKAIQALNQYISSSNSPQLRNALITCLLFVCFEILQGSFSAAQQQIYGGLKILQSYYTGKSGSRAAAHRRLSTTENSRPMPEALSKTLNLQVGCGIDTQDKVIVSHVKEYLDSTTNTGLVIEVEAPSPERATSEPTGMPPFEASHLSDEAMETSVDFTPQIQRALSMHVHDHPLDVSTNYAPSVALQPLNQPDLTSLSIQKTLPSGSSSVASSPYSDTSPPRGIQTPSSQIPSSSRKRPASTRSTPTPLLLQSNVKIENILVQTFVRLDGQCLFFGSIPGIPPLNWDVNQVHHIPVPVFFPDFHSAHRCWDSLMDRALQFYRRTLFDRAYSTASRDSPSSIARQLTSWQKQLSAFETTFRPILDDAVQLDGIVNSPAALVISLAHKCVSILLRRVPRDSEMVFDAALSDFQYIVRTCALLLSSQEQIQLPLNPRFSFEFGVVAALHLVATKCRDPVVRREAVDLLWSNPRQEGMWEGVICARIGLWILNSEEAGLLAPQLPLRNSSMPGLWQANTTGYQYGNPAAPFFGENTGSSKNFDCRSTVTEGVDQGLGLDECASSRGGDGMVHRGNVSNPRQQIPRKSKGKGKGPVNMAKGWVVPEENRVQLRGYKFHIPERHVNVTVQKALPTRSGSREEREIVLAW